MLYQIAGAVIVIAGLLLNQWTPKAHRHAKHNGASSVRKDYAPKRS